jgi:hypothetical protein
MSSARRFPLLVVLALGVAATGFATTLHHPTNPSELPGGLRTSVNAESTALYCTGLSSAAPGRVSFFNTADVARSLGVTVVSNLGATWSGTIELGAHAGQIVVPTKVDAPAVHRTKSGHATTAVVSYAVAAQISGGGVVADEIQGDASVPCVAQGVTQWYATGFNTVVGSDAYVSLYNPTGTEAVVNVSVLGATGFSAPAELQGVSVPAHSQSEIDLGHNVVNTSNVAVGVKVLRGSLAIVGEQDSAGTVSFDQGSDAPQTDAWFPAVTTANGATAEVRISNPNNTAASVSIDVELGTYKIAPQTTSIAPFTTGVITITPTPAIPAAGYASLRLHANVPVVAGLAVGQGSEMALSSPQTPSQAQVVRDFTGLGFDAQDVTNTSARAVTVRVTTYEAGTTTSKTGAITLPADSTTTLSTLIVPPEPIS